MGVGGRVPILVVGRDGTLLVSSGDSDRLEILGVLRMNCGLPGWCLDLNMKGRKKETEVGRLEVRRGVGGKAQRESTSNRGHIWEMQTFTGDSQYASVCGGSLLTRSGLAQSLRRPICTKERRSG